MFHRAEQVRQLAPTDLALLNRLLSTSEYIYQRFTPEELKHILRTFPAFGVFLGASLRAFLVSQTVNPPSSWIGGFGVSWSESRGYQRYLDVLLESLIGRLGPLGVRQLYYSGNDLTNDWLREPLLQRQFRDFRQLYAYDKFDYLLPTGGNQAVTLHRATGQDLATILALEELCFEQLWRYDPATMLDIISTHPYFVIAELNGLPVGYQFNALDGDYGYLVRIGVHPAYQGQGVGARLMAEAIRFFQSAGSTRIMLNTQQENTHAHRLYEWFGFVRIEQVGFILRYDL